jgi:putative Mg2+ transporter-C (MgtC) family protein
VDEIGVIYKLVIAAFLGGVIGLERERYGRMAGFRTHILVCLGSCLIMLTSVHIFYMVDSQIAADPGRIAAGVVTGIGFLGAGTIMRFRASVIGLTTAASLWAVAGIGLAVGSGFFSAAYASAVIVLITLVVFGRLEKKYFRREIYKVLNIITEAGASHLEDIRKAIAVFNIETIDYEFKRLNRENELSVKVTLKLVKEQDIDNVIHEVMKTRGVKSASWEY